MESTHESAGLSVPPLLSHCQPRGPALMLGVCCHVFISVPTHSTDTANQADSMSSHVCFIQPCYHQALSGIPYARLAPEKNIFPQTESGTCLLDCKAGNHQQLDRNVFISTQNPSSCTFFLLLPLVSVSVPRTLTENIASSQATAIY